jgi:predicted RNA binding protein YcfA (HicA-like mRNA interferase family)
MEPKFPILTPKEITSALQRMGFYYVSQKGSHIKYSNGIRTTIIPNHKEVARGTLKSILELADVRLEHFLTNL